MSSVDEVTSTRCQHYIDAGHYLSADGSCPCDVDPAATRKGARTVSFSELEASPDGPTIGRRTADLAVGDVLDQHGWIYAVTSAPTKLIGTYVVGMRSATAAVQSALGTMPRHNAAKWASQPMETVAPPRSASAAP